LFTNNTTLKSGKAAYFSKMVSCSMSNTENKVNLKKSRLTPPHFFSLKLRIRLFQIPGSAPEEWWCTTSPDRYCDTYCVWETTTVYGGLST